MKKVLLSLLVIAAVTVFTSSTFAQYAIPSYDVPVIADPTTFEEAVPTTSFYVSPFTKANQTNQVSVPDGRRKLNVTTIDSNINTTAWATIEIYSLDGNITYGPYTVYEGLPFSQFLSDEYEWGVNTIDASEGCEMSVWFD